VVLRDGETATGAEIVAHARERLAGFKSPKYVVLVDELPKNPSGKILKRELRDTYAGLADAEAPSSRGEGHV
jgi:fatty-acyl-CoA synthase